MSKGKIVWVCAVIVVLGLLYFVLSSLSIVKPFDRVVWIETPGGSIPIRLVVFDQGDAYIVPGDDSYGRGGILTTRDNVFTVAEYKREKGILKIKFDAYDSILQLRKDGPNSRYIGSWTKNRGENGIAKLSASVPNLIVRSWYEPISTEEKVARFEGRWSVRFESSDGFAVGEFHVAPQSDGANYGIAQGTFMTTTGDYRFLAGRVDGNLMRLSTFDGAHAFLFHARMQDDGTIEGDFWSGNWWHETWTAVRDEDAALPDAFEQTVIADEDALDDMVFKNLQGEPTRVLDVLDESNAPARIIEIFGTWCPNCSDAGRELVSLREQYGDDLAVVGLAFEVTEDFERSVQQVKHHHEHIGTDWPILIAGLSDKDKASQALPVLDKVRSYPTLIFLDRNNEVQGVYSGFSGPATGDAYIKQRERFEALIESMID